MGKGANNNHEAKLREALGDANYEQLGRFSARLVKLNKAANRVKFYRNYASMLAPFLNKRSFFDLTYEDVQNIVAAVDKAKSPRRGGEYSALTRRGFKIALRKLVQFAYYEDALGKTDNKKEAPPYDWNSNEFPPSVRWLHGEPMKACNRTVSPNDLMSYDELGKITEAAGNDRDKAWCAVNISTGWRPDEIQGLKVGDVRFSDGGQPLLTIRGYKRKGDSRFLVPVEVPRLMRWLEQHPDKNNPSAPLWCALGKPKPICSDYFRLKLKKWAVRAGITKRVWPYLFRHIFTTVNPYRLSEEQLDVWLGNSYTVRHRTYNNLTPEDVNNFLAGKGQAKDRIQARKCPTCTHTNSFENQFCTNCSRPLTEAARAQREHELTQDMNVKIADAVAKAFESLQAR